MRTAATTASRHLPAYGAALLLVIALVLLAPALEGRTELVLFGVAVVGLAVLPVVLSSKNRKTMLLGASAFIVAFSGIDKWFLYRPHLGGAPGIELSIADLWMAVLYAVWLWDALSAKPTVRGQRMPINGVLPAGLGFVALMSLSFINAVSPELLGFELLQTAKLLLWLVYIGYNVRTVEHLRALGAGIASAVVVHSAFAVAEKLMGRTLGFALLGEAEGQAVGLFAGEYTRVGGLMGSPILLAAFFASTLPFLLAVIAGSTKAWTRAAGVAAVLASAAGLAVTLSRGPAIAWLFCFGWFFAALALRGRLKGRARDVFIGLAVLIVLTLVAASPLIYDRFMFSDPGSIQARQQLMGIASQLIAEHPLAGIGLNNWAVIMAAYDTTGISALTTAPVHNIYLLLWAETGVIGLAGFGALVAVLLTTAYRAFRDAAAIEVQLAALAAATSVMAILIKGLASLDLRYAPEHQLFWFVAGLIVAVRRMSVTTEDLEPESDHKAGVQHG